MNWISVSERLPAIDAGSSGPMLVWIPADHVDSQDTPEVVSAASVFIADYHARFGWVMDDGTEQHVAQPAVTHWMPLPRPPEGP